MRKYIVLFEKSKDGISSYVPDLPGCAAFGDTKEEAEQLIYEAIKFHIEGMELEGELIPQSLVDSETMIFS